MSSETDHPRQRTVAELLAAHGGATPATGRRRRRREADDTGGSAPVAAGRADAASETTALTPPPTQVDRGVLRQPVPRAAPPRSPSAPRRAAAPPPPAPPIGRSGSSTRPARENPTDVLPRVRGPQPADGLTAPLTGRGPAGDEGGPSTMVGMAPVGAEDWHAARTATHRGGTAIDGGPPLPVAPRIAGAGPAGLGGPADLREHDDGYDDRDPDDAFGGREPGDRGPGRRGFADRDHLDDEHDLDRPPPRERRLGRSAREAPPTTWTTWWLQVLSGALAGAVVWVGFRFLWRSLPVVAVAAAVVVVVGLVLVVRTLLHSEDRRTTVFAVLVGLLLTASPAVLVLLGR